MASITAVADPTNTPPRVALTVTGLDGTQANVLRHDPDGSLAPVRGTEPASLVSGGWVGYDYEAPYAASVSYEAISLDGTDDVSTSALTLDPRRAWLVHPGVPSLSRPLVGLTVGDDTFASTTGVHQILGRATPVVITDGKRKAATFSFDFYTSTTAERDAVEVLLSDISPLLLLVSYPGVSDTIRRWVALGDVTRSATTALSDTPGHVWSASATVCDRPAGLLASQRTWADVTEATWADVLTDFATWLDVVTG